MLGVPGQDLQGPIVRWLWQIETKVGSRDAVLLRIVNSSWTKYGEGRPGVGKKPYREGPGIQRS